MPYSNSEDISVTRLIIKNCILRAGITNYTYFLGGETF